MKNELAQLREDISELLSTAKNLGKSTARTAKTKAENELDELLDKLDRTYASARSSGEHAIDSFQKEIEHNPLFSMVVAFFSGLIIGKLFSQK